MSGSGGHVSDCEVTYEILVAHWPYCMLQHCLPGGSQGNFQRHPSPGSPGADLSFRLFHILPFIFLPGAEGENRKKALLSWNPWALGLGCSIVGIELGVVYMYRAGWTVQTSFILTNSLIVAALMVTGALFYGEKLKLRQLAGAVLTLAGIACIVWQ